QARNAVTNTTTNERANRLRYPWLSSPSGRLFNYFDRGVCLNLVEFATPGGGRGGRYLTA
ncbi:unnamed protein product, partial [Discosporangium mesarthrocarpum]